MPLGSKRNRLTAAQQDILCEFFELNPEVICGYKKKPDCIEAVQAKWRKVSVHLNSLGPPRHHRAWAKYLCDAKAKLKRKKIKWKQRSDGSGPLICNAEEFTEIGIRMLQVLSKETSNDAQDTQEQEENEDVYEENNAGDESDSTTLHTKDSKMDVTDFTNLDIPPIPQQSELAPRVFVTQNVCGDEFDTFGRNVAQQLRSLPLPVALETQELLLSVIRKQRLKVLSKARNTSFDPLAKT